MSVSKISYTLRVWLTRDKVIFWKIVIGFVHYYMVGKPNGIYSMKNPRRRMEKAQERGKARKVEVTLDNIRKSKEKRKCKRNCLGDVDEKYILDQ